MAARDLIGEVGITGAALSGRGEVDIDGEAVQVIARSPIPADHYIYVQSVDTGGRAPKVYVVDAGPIDAPAGPAAPAGYYAAPATVERYGLRLDAADFAGGQPGGPDQPHRGPASPSPEDVYRWHERGSDSFQRLNFRLTLDLGDRGVVHTDASRLAAYGANWRTAIPAYLADEYDIDETYELDIDVDDIDGYVEA